MPGYIKRKAEGRFGTERREARAIVGLIA
jgi:hypothetical protein